MLGKKGLSIIIVSVFAIICLIVVFSIFNVKGVDATYTLYDTSEEKVGTLESALNKYVGKNLLFVNTDSIVSEIEQDAYLEVTAIEKQYPNKINITIKERKEVYLVEHNEKKYVLADDGFVLSEFTASDYDTREYIEITLDGIGITELSVGANVKSDCDEMLYLAFDIAKEVKLSDCIDSFKITGYTDLVGEEFKTCANLEFNTYTKVKIVVNEIHILGKEKTVKAFDLCDKDERDYIKSNNEIHVTILQSTNEIEAHWTWETVDKLKG